MTFSLAIPWNQGEQQMHQLLNIPDLDNPTSSMLTPQASFMLQKATLLALGTLDSQSRPWTTLWGGRSGFSEPLGGGIIGTRTNVDGKNDPVVQALFAHTEKGEMRQGNQKMISGLAIDLMTRKRVKIFGRMVAGAVGEVDVELPEGQEMSESVPDKQDQVQLVMKIEQSLGNCPKYLNQYELKPALVDSKLASLSATLSDQAKSLIHGSSMFFLSSTTTEDMDTNHRGGAHGFVRVLSNTEFVYPEYSGNRFYQTIGNLVLNPKVGVTFPDYESGTVLYTTGTADILVGEEAAKLLPGSTLALKITIEESRVVEGGLPFRGVRKEPSPYNPRIRTLVSEGNVRGAIPSLSSYKAAALVKKTQLTPTIARFRFRIPDGITYHPGQWVALDFKKDLDYGYSHMRDDDPRSINDDFVRTFTISSSPAGGGGKEQDEFDMIIRDVGPVTAYLSTQNGGAGFKVKVLGVGGDFKVKQKSQRSVFLASGVGITPLLGQIPHLDQTANLTSKVRLIWTVKAVDVGLAVDVLQQYPQLASGTTLFITGADIKAGGELHENVGGLEATGATVQNRRIRKEDVQVIEADSWYLCVPLGFRKELEDWLGGKDVSWEDFY